jgi:hypothetical protein
MAYILRFHEPLTGNFSDYYELKERLTCHLLVDCLPAEALSEVQSSIMDAIEFYELRQLPLERDIRGPAFDYQMQPIVERDVVGIAEE